MNYLREYEIAWQGLKNGVHEWQFKVNDDTLKRLGYENEDFSGLETIIDVKFEKENSFFILDFGVHGKADVVCDRCGDTFPLTLWDDFNLVVKLTDSEEKAEQLNRDETEDIVYISRTDAIINIFKWVYEFIVLSFPIQRIHPNKDNGESGCNPEALKLLNQLKGKEDSEREDSIWKDLDNIKNKLS